MLHLFRSLFSIVCQAFVKSLSQHGYFIYFFLSAHTDDHYHFYRIQTHTLLSVIHYFRFGENSRIYICTCCNLFTIRFNIDHVHTHTRTHTPTERHISNDLRFAFRAHKSVRYARLINNHDHRSSILSQQLVRQSGSQWNWISIVCAMCNACNFPSNAKFSKRKKKHDKDDDKRQRKRKNWEKKKKKIESSAYSVQRCQTECPMSMECVRGEHTVSECYFEWNAIQTKVRECANMRRCATSSCPSVVKRSRSRLSARARHQNAHFVLTETFNCRLFVVCRLQLYDMIMNCSFIHSTCIRSAFEPHSMHE